MAPQNYEVASEGWVVEVDTASGATRRPTVVGEPSFDPGLKSLPKVRLPVVRDGSWEASKWEDAPMRVWRDGERLPIETLQTRVWQPDKTVLVGVGGDELFGAVTVEQQVANAHELAETIIGQTSYDSVVDTPPRTDGVEMVSASTQSEMSTGYLPTNIYEPTYVDSDGDLQLSQTCHFYETEDLVSDPDNTITETVYSGGEAIDLTGPSTVSGEFTLNHTIRSEDVDVFVRLELDDYDGDLEFLLDGERVGVKQTGAGSLSTTLQWESFFDLSDEITVDEISAKTKGEHTFEIAELNFGTGSAIVDCFAIFDTRYHTGSSFDNSTNADGGLSSPALYPDGIKTRVLRRGFRSFKGAEFDGTFDDVSGSQSITISPDYGTTTTVASNSASVSDDFADSGRDVDIRIELDRWGSDSTRTPTSGFKSQTLGSYNLFIDTVESPPFVNERFVGDRRDILTQLARRGDSLWAVTWDNQADAPRVEFTNAGQRDAVRDPDVVNYDWTTETLRKQVTWAVIRSEAISVEAESFIANTAGADLSQDNLLERSEKVYDQATGTEFESGMDYEIDYGTGSISILSAGTMTPGETYWVDYEWIAEGEYQASATPKKKIVEKIPGVTSNPMAQSIAYWITERAGDPVQSGTATVRELPAGVSVLDALASDVFPVESAHIRSVDSDYERTQIEFANRQSVGELIGDIRDRLNRLGERV